MSLGVTKLLSGFLENKSKNSSRASCPFFNGNPRLLQNRYWGYTFPLPNKSAYIWQHKFTFGNVSERHVQTEVKIFPSGESLPLEMHLKDMRIRLHNSCLLGMRLKNMRKQLKIRPLGARGCSALGSNGSKVIEFGYSKQRFFINNRSNFMLLTCRKKVPPPPKINMSSKW